MGLLDFFKNKDDKSEELAQILKNLSPEEVQRSLVQYIGGGLVVPEDNAQTFINHGYDANDVVHSAVRYISRRAAQLPILVVQKNRDGSEEYLYDHPVCKLLKNPNPVMDQGEFIEQALGFYLLTGNSFTYAINSTTREGGYPLEMYPLPSQYVDIEVGGGVGGQIVKSYQLNTVSQQKFEPENVIHLRTPNYNYQNGEWLYGISPLKAALQSLNANNSGQKGFAKLMQNLGAIGLLMKDAGAQLTQSQARDVQRYITKNIQGENNRGAIRVLSHAYKYQSLALSADELKMIEGQEMTARQIFSIYGLDSKLFNDHKASSYNNMNEAKKSAYTEAILPTMNALVRKLDNYFFKDQPELSLKVDTSGIEVLKKDVTQLISALNQAYYIPNSQKQKMIGLEPDMELPEYLVPMGLTPVDSMDIDVENIKRLNDLMQGKK